MPARPQAQRTGADGPGGGVALGSSVGPAAAWRTAPDGEAPDWSDGPSKGRMGLVGREAVVAFSTVAACLNDGGARASKRLLTVEPIPQDPTIEALELT
jgi:hypothetical protein